MLRKYVMWLSLITASLLSNTGVAGDYDAELEVVRSLGDLTDVPAIYDGTGAITTVSVGTIQDIYYETLEYKGVSTRAYAWIGIPEEASADNPVPGVVLVHGGGGTAYYTWVEKWVDRGYAAISIAVEGQTSEVVDGARVIHEWAGPARDGIYGDSDEVLTDQWMYHAVADTILANSLLQSLPEVRAQDVGVMGVSWGGVITSTAIGIDDRFRFAIPAYGTGYKYTIDNQYGSALEDNDLYFEVWDPAIRMNRATMPALWLSWPEEDNFSLDSQAMTYTDAPGARMVSIIPGLGHGHGKAWNPLDSYEFADSIINDDQPWCTQQYLTQSGGEIEVIFYSTKTLDSASVITTLDSGYTGDRTWSETSLTLTDIGDGLWSVVGSLPKNTTAWVVNVHSATLIASSDFKYDAEFGAEVEDDSVIIPYYKVNDQARFWSTNTVNLWEGDSVFFAPNPNSGGSWSWTGPNNYTHDARKMTLSDVGAEVSGYYTATYIDDAGNSYSFTFNVVVSSLPSEIKAYSKVNSDRWLVEDMLDLSAGDHLSFAPHPNYGGSWAWTGPNGFTGNTRGIQLTDMKIEDTGYYVATHTNDEGMVSYQIYDVEVK